MSPCRENKTSVNVINPVNWISPKMQNWINTGAGGKKSHRRRLSRAGGQTPVVERHLRVCNWMEWWRLRISFCRVLLKTLLPSDAGEKVKTMWKIIWISTCAFEVHNLWISGIDQIVSFWGGRYDGGWPWGRQSWGRCWARQELRWSMATLPKLPDNWNFYLSASVVGNISMIL